MSNNAPDYKDNLAFEPKEYSAPYCDILELKEKLKKQDEELTRLKEIEAHTWDYDLQAQRISELLDENKHLKDKLDIAVKALEKYAKRKSWQDIELYDVVYFSAQFKCCGYEIAEKALAKMK